MKTALVLAVSARSCFGRTSPVQMLQHQALHCRIVCLPNKTSGCARHIIRGQFRCNRFANESHCMLLFFSSPLFSFHFFSFCEGAGALLILQCAEFHFPSTPPSAVYWECGCVFRTRFSVSPAFHPQCGPK